MPAIDHVVTELSAWTPFLAAGFLWNIVISLVAFALGTALGYMMVRLRLSRVGVARRAGGTATELMRNVPTYVFQFYLVFMLPDALPLPCTAARVPLPPWLKAALALALAVAAFVSDSLLRTLRAWRQGRREDVRLFVSSCANYFVIIVMASSTASVIGVPELVSRCNTVINVIGTSSAMLWVYLYAMAWFFLFCSAMSMLVRGASRRLDRRRGDD
ncbi:ABC transporter permease subunit [Trinickia fusca]|uniref:Polar amino acid ABC transporter permease n=1 Tax=Trinickia fusca TaxID=2419777 RepID=A0A494XNK1_9BURK|nr:ABC transporter permease subunit [Trinickia fusca]RKP52245.1 polar amino acid ABC transporter permease [Trinickia fusca]